MSVTVYRNWRKCDECGRLFHVNQTGEFIRRSRKKTFTIGVKIIRTPGHRYNEERNICFGCIKKIISHGVKVE